MLIEKIALSDDGRSYMTVYIQEESPEIRLSHKRPMVVVCPGGGYAMTSDREAEPIALVFAAQGFNTCVVRYSVGEFAAWPTPLAELSKAIRIIRRRAAEFLTDVDKIAVCGFSAGGHLVSALGALWNDSEIQRLSLCKDEENRPNALILCYPVIDAYKYTHRPSVDILMQAVKDDEQAQIALKETLATNENVGDHTPPTFIFHTCKDSVVPVQNSLMFGMACAEHGIPFEMHIFQNGDHGLALCDNRTYANPSNLNKEAAAWTDLASAWLWNLFGREE